MDLAPLMPGHANTETIDGHTPQAVYDAFNTFIFSDDTKILAKLVARTLLLQRTMSVPGDIVECGVFKGSGLATWGKLKRILCPNARKKVIGFDYFDTETLVHSLSGADQARMAALFGERNFTHGNDAEALVNTVLSGAGLFSHEYELISGPIATTALICTAQRPGFRISLLYCDLDLGEATYDALTALWPRVSTGGLAVFDEYGYHQWSESQGVDQFCAEHGLTLQPLDFPCPTACLVKS